MSCADHGVTFLYNSVVQDPSITLCAGEGEMLFGEHECQADTQ